MSKIWLSFLLSALLLFSLASFVYGVDINGNIMVGAKDIVIDENGSIVTAINVNGQGSEASGKYMINANGEQVQINGGIKLNDGQVQVFSGKMDAAKAEVILRMANVTLNLSNGKNTSIKVMPSTASAVAIARLGINVCSEENNCTIEFKETGKRDNVRLVYHVEAQKQAKVLLLFKAKMNVSADVDVESGALVSSNKPWWAIVAKE